MAKNNKDKSSKSPRWMKTTMILFAVYAIMMYSWNNFIGSNSEEENHRIYMENMEATKKEAAEEKKRSKFCNEWAFLEEKYQNNKATQVEKQSEEITK